ncbi:hypothetical protein BJ912DRAFT_938738 [Pholiota molesta]|nr:hypothetical protein BJ912DRAFT_938738 [Pholiota molesta]
MATLPRNGAEERAKILAVPIGEEEIAHISGNAPFHVKEGAVRWYKIFSGQPGYATFCSTPRRGVRIQEVSLEPSIDDPQKTCTKMVVEMEVTPDMCNVQGILDRGCMYGLIDEGSAIALHLMRLTEGAEDRISVSQTLNVVFYQPVPSIGAKLKIINRSLSTGRDSGSCNSEIWNGDQHRRVASGTQVQMMPSGLTYLGS